MTDRWPEVLLPEVLEFREGPGIMAVDFVEAGTPLIRLAGLKSGAQILAGCNYLDPVKVSQRWKQFQLAEGDVLLSTSASLGEVAQVSVDGVGAVPYTGIIAFRPRDERVHPQFVRFMLIDDRFKEQIEAMGVGSVMKHFGPSHLRKMTVSVPPIDEQRAIADVLGALDDKIASNSRLVETGGELAASLVRSAIDPTSTVRLDEIALVTMGSSPPGSSYNETGTGMVFYQGVRDFGVRFPKHRVWTTSPLRTAEPMDTLVSVRAPVGETNLARETTCIGRGLASLRSSAGSPMTLFHLLRNNPQVWEPFEAGGTVFGSINKTQLEGLEIPAIVGDGTSLEARVSAIEARIAAALDESTRLGEMRDALLPALMSGRLRVSDADKSVEEVL